MAFPSLKDKVKLKDDSTKLLIFFLIFYVSPLWCAPSSIREKFYPSQGAADEEMKPFHLTLPLVPFGCVNSATA